MYSAFFKWVVVCFGAALFLFSCDGTEEAERVDYFPLAVGHHWTYETSEVIFDTLTTNEVLTYQEYYEITDRFENNEGGLTYVIRVSSRPSSADDWEFQETWSAKVSANELIVNEGNIAYIKLLIPPAAGMEWKGNKYNTIESERANNRVDIYSFQEVRKPFDEFTNTVTVEESDDVNLIYKDVRRSVYGANTGLVFRFSTYIEYCITCENIKTRISERTKTQTLIEYEIQ